MAVYYRITQDNRKNSAHKGEYYGRAVYEGTVDEYDLAKAIEAKCTVHRADVVAVIIALIDEQIADCTLCLMTHIVLTLGRRFNQYEALGELFRETRRELFELTQWRRTLEIIKNLLNVLAVKLCINVADTLENLMEGTQAVNELEAILLALSPLEAVADN